MDTGLFLCSTVKSFKNNAIPVFCAALGEGGADLRSKKKKKIFFCMCFGVDVMVAFSS